MSNSSDRSILATGSNLDQISRVILTPSLPYVKGTISSETDKSMTVKSMTVSAIDYRKPYVYALKDYSSILIIDVSDPNQPQVKLTFRDDKFSTSLQDLKIADNYLLVTDLLKGLWIIDISDPLLPKRTGLLSDSLGYGICVGEKETGPGGEVRRVYLTNWKYGLKIYDWSGGDHFVLRSNPVVWDLLSPFNLDVYPHSSAHREYIYIADGDSVKIITESGEVVKSLGADFWPDPNADEPIGEYIPDILDVKLKGDYAYVVDRRYGLYVLDVKIPEYPVVKSRLPLPGGRKSITIQGNLALVAAGFSGLDLIDISVPSNPVFRYHVFTHGDANLSKVETEAEDYVFIANGYAGFTVLDIQSLSAPAPVGHLPMKADIWDITVAADLAYISLGKPGLKIVDVADPWNPSLAASVEKEDIGGGSILVSDCCPYQDRFYLVNGSNLCTFGYGQENPSLMENLAWYDPVQAITIEGNYLYMISLIQGLSIFQINSRLSSQGKLSLGSMPQNLFVKDNIAYIANGTQGLWVVDVSDPARPRKISQTPISSLVLDVAVKEDYAYLVNGSYGLSVVNMAENTQPVQSIEFKDEYLEDCSVQDDFLYAAGNSYGVWVMDISDPSLPVILDNLPTLRGANVVFADQEHVYVGDRFGMLDIYLAPRNLLPGDADRDPNSILFSLPTGLPGGFYDLTFVNTQGEKIRRYRAVQIENQAAFGLKRGLNLFGYPGKVPAEYSDSYRLMGAMKVRAYFFQQENLGEITYRQPPDGDVFEIYGDIFEIEDRRGYLLYLLEDTPVTAFQSDYFYPLDEVLREIGTELKEGGNLISFPIEDIRAGSFDILGKLQESSYGKRVTGMHKLNNVSGKWESTYGFYNQCGGQNFSIKRGEGYLVY